MPISYYMPKLLLEDTYQFVPDRTQLTERLAKPEGRSFPFRLPGLLSECDTVNGNNRIYPEPVWLKNVTEGSPLRKRLQERSAFGLTEHPKDGTVSLNSPICWIVTDVHMEGKKVVGEVTIVNTPEGHKMLALIEAGYNPLVSSRGFGSLVKRNDGVDVVQEDYVCEGWDAVYNPSFGNARLDGSGTRETIAAVAASKPVETARGGYSAKDLFAAMNAARQEGLLKLDGFKLDGNAIVLENAKAAVTTILPAAEPAKAQPQNETNKENQMEKITAIRESLNSLRATDPSKLDPSRLAAGLTHLQGLHRQAAVCLSEDAKSSWDIEQLHDEISAVEKSWTEAATAPKLEAAKLTEAQGKVIKALHATATLAMKYRDRLGEALKENAKLKEDRKTAIERGRGWMHRATTVESELDTATKRLDLCYEGLDEFTRRYEEDVTEIAGRMLALEFKDKVDADPKIQEALKAAKKPSELIAIREQLEGKVEDAGTVEAPAATAPDAVKTEAAPAAPSPTGAVGESKQTVTIAKPVGVADPKPTTTTLSGFRRPFSVAESVSSAQRLSKAYKDGAEVKPAAAVVLTS